MQATSLEELEKMIENEIKKALAESATQSLLIMSDATREFYEGGTPTMYVRTGALGRAPAIDPPKKTGDGYEFKAYMDKDHTYDTGKKPTMEQVLSLTNDGHYKGLRPAVGAKGYWDRALQKMKDTTRDTFIEHFG